MDGHGGNPDGECQKGNYGPGMEMIRRTGKIAFYGKTSKFVNIPSKNQAQGSRRLNC
jgi:hypothetical protein